MRAYKRTTITKTFRCFLPQSITQHWENKQSNHPNTIKPKMCWGNFSYISYASCRISPANVLSAENNNIRSDWLERIAAKHEIIIKNMYKERRPPPKQSHPKIHLCMFPLPLCYWAFVRHLPAISVPGKTPGEDPQNAIYKESIYPRTQTPPNNTRATKRTNDKWL